MWVLSEGPSVRRRACHARDDLRIQMQGMQKMGGFPERQHSDDFLRLVMPEYSGGLSERGVFSLRVQAFQNDAATSVYYDSPSTPLGMC